MTCFQASGRGIISLRASQGSSAAFNPEHAHPVEPQGAMLKRSLDHFRLQASRPSADFPPSCKGPIGQFSREARSGRCALQLVTVLPLEQPLIRRTIDLFRREDRPLSTAAAPLRQLIVDAPLPGGRESWDEATAANRDVETEQGWLQRRPSPPVVFAASRSGMDMDVQARQFPQRCSRISRLCCTASNESEAVDLARQHYARPAAKRRPGGHTVRFPQPVAARRACGCSSRRPPTPAIP